MFIKKLQIILSFYILAAIADDVPWFEHNQGTKVNSVDQFKQLMEADNATLANKHVFVYFFMTRCPYCVQYAPIWNELTQILTDKYGKDQVEFLLINKDTVRALPRQFSVRSFPSVLYFYPNKQGKQYEKFFGMKSYDNMMIWMEGNLKMNGAHIVSQDEKPTLMDGVPSESMSEDEHDHDHDEQIETEIVSITDKETGEDIKFEIEKPTPEQQEQFAKDNNGQKMDISPKE